MKPFSLDTVLSYRERLETMAQEALTIARREEDEVLHELELQRHKSDNLSQQLHTIQSDGVSINELILMEEQLTFVRARMKELEQQLADKREKVKRAHEHLVQKSRERQVMEKLKERQNAAWKQYLDKKEAAMLDEMAIVYHDRK